MTQTENVSTDLTAAEAAELLLVERGLNAIQAHGILHLEWPNTLSDPGVSTWWLGYLEGYAAALAVK